MDFHPPEFVSVLAPRLRPAAIHVLTVEITVGGGMVQLPTFIWQDLGLRSAMVMEAILTPE